MSFDTIFYFKDSIPLNEMKIGRVTNWLQIAEDITNKKLTSECEFSFSRFCEEAVA